MELFFLLLNSSSSTKTTKHQAIGLRAKSIIPESCVRGSDNNIILLV